MTIVIVVLVFAVIMWSIIPDLIESITGFIKNFDNNVNVVTDILDKYDEHLTFINDYVEKIDWNSILKSLERLPEHFSRAYLRVFHR